MFEVIMINLNTPYKWWQLLGTCIDLNCFIYLSVYFFFTKFSAVVCPKLTVPDKGGVVPSSCSKTDVEYGTRCVFYCGDGYALSGPRYTTCQDDTSWSEIASLSCVRGQFVFSRGLTHPTVMFKDVQLGCQHFHPMMKLAQNFGVRLTIFWHLYATATRNNGATWQKNY